ncbi:MAG: L-threonylcarbamoyladenylate synthase [Halothiobacillaceae bacterium]|jgi:tRNA threonylcarbamoyl adenosine modification protein (Sua5/YciO/YrdC/YwlC family)
MARILALHPQNPQARLLDQAVEALRGGGVIAFPTDSGYALGCGLGDKAAIERMRAIRGLGEKHHFTLMCRDLSEIATYARVGNVEYRFLRQYTPGPYTFILQATHEVPRRLQHPKRKTVGLRVPGHPLTQALLAALGEPLLSTSLILPDESEPLCDPYDIDDRIGNRVELILDVGFCADHPTTVIDLSGGTPVLVRRGRGAVPAGVEEAE